MIFNHFFYILNDNIVVSNWNFRFINLFIWVNDVLAIALKVL